MPPKKKRAARKLKKDVNGNKTKNNYLTNATDQNKICMNNKEEVHNSITENNLDEIDGLMYSGSSNNNLNDTTSTTDKDNCVTQNITTDINSDSTYVLLNSVSKKLINHLYNSNYNVNDTNSLDGNGSNIKQLDKDIHTNIDQDTVSKSAVLETDETSKKSKYDLSIYDYDEEDSLDESQRLNAGIKCKFCPFKAETPIDLLKHKRNTHTVQRIILPLHEIQKYFDHPDRTFCPVCEQPVKSRNFRSIFVKHLLVHAPGFYECRICKKKFRRLDHMRIHEKRHVLSFAELRVIQDTIDNDPVELPFIVNKINT